MFLQTKPRDCLIDGIWHCGEGESFQKTCPATGALSWAGRAASTAQVEAAVASARKAFEHWSLTPLAERVAVMERYAVELAARKDALAQAISGDMGKLLTEARLEVDAMVSKVAISIQAQTERAGDKSMQMAFGQLELTHRPHGVMAVFGPYNFPGHLPNGHIVPALLAGNTCVFKPSELAPSVAPLMMEALEAAGLEPGCVNLVQGGRETGTALLQSDIDGLLFTGSETTGLYFHRFFAGRPEVMLALEMGGNNPLVIWDAEDVEAAAKIAVTSAFLTTGQRCSCARRLILPEGRFGDDVLEAMLAQTRALKIGARTDEAAFMGPLVNAQAAQAVLDYQTRLSSLGGRTLCAAQQLEPDRGFVTAGLVEMTDAKAPDEELFGPLLQVFRVRTLDAAIKRANATRFGLSGGIITEDDDVWAHTKCRLRAGILNRNRPTAGASSAMPFGGPGRSGNFRPGGYYAADYCAWPQASQIAH
ncbi:MAG: succinylglutamate-semialdehyde dehydrogenase [Hyphomonadaceae bacterium]|nr:succinylglutamate-semialdehyde dehydrogenase [Hyphomonadaceae bacterium]